MHRNEPRKKRRASTEKVTLCGRHGEKREIPPAEKAVSRSTGHAEMSSRETVQPRDSREIEFPQKCVSGRIRE